MTGNNRLLSSTRFPKTLWHWFTEPAAAIRDSAQRREARLLASLIGVLVLLGFWAEILPVLIDPAERQAVLERPSSLVGIAAILLLVIVYGLSRTGYYKWAAALTVALCSVGIFVIVLPGEAPSDLYFFVYLILPVLFASIFFPVKTTVAVIMLNATGILLFPLLVPAADPFELPFFFFYMVSILIVIAARHRNLVAKDQQAQLAESEARYRVLFEGIDDAIFVYDQDANILDVNEAACRRLGYSRDELLHMKTTELDSPEYAAGFGDRLARQLAEGSLSEIGGIHIAKDGRRIYIDATSKTITYRGQKAILAVVRDITARQRAEEALQKAREELEQRVTERTAELQAANTALTLEVAERERVEATLAKERNLLRTLIDNLPDDIYVKDCDGRLLVANKVLAHHLGEKTPDALAGKTDFDYFPRERAEEFLASEQEIFRSGQPMVNQETARANPDGSVTWLSTTKVPFRETGGKIVGLVGVTRDITAWKEAEAALERARDELERRVQERTAELTAANAQLQQEILERMRTEEALRESEARFRGIFESAAAGIALVDQHGQVLASNAALQEMLGYTAEELARMHYADFTHPEDLESEAPLVRETVVGERDLYRMEKRCIRKDGSVLWVRLTSSAVRGPEGDYLYGLGIVEDITRRKRAEAAEREQRILAEALRDTAAAFSATLDFNEVLDRILTNIERAMPHDAAAVMLIEAGVARIVRSRGYEQRGFSDAAITTLRFPIAEVANMRAMLATQQPCVIPDVRDDPNWVAFPETAWVRSNATAPIRLEGEVIGFLDLNSATPGAFTDLHAERLQAFAEQAALAIRNARLYQAEQEQRVLAEALRDTAAALNAILDYDEVLKRILANVGRVAPHDAASITLIKNGAARVVRERGYKENGVKPEALSFSVTETATLRHMTKTRQPLVIPDVHTFPGWVDVPEERWIRAYAGAPIFLEGELIGFLNLNSATPGAFTDAHAERLQAFAEQAALAIKNARLFEAEQEQRALAEALRDTAAAVSATLDLDEVLERILTNVGRVVPHDAANIMLIESGVAHVVRGRGYFQRNVDAMMLRFPLAETATLRAMSETRQPLVISDVQVYNNWVEVPDEHWIRSYAGVPILVRSYAGAPMFTKEKLIGFLSLDSATPGAFTDNDGKHLQAFADQAAIAIENARLYRESQDRNRQLALLNQITRVGAVILEWDELLQTLVDTAAGIIGGDGCYITLWDAEHRRTIPAAAFGPMRDVYRQGRPRQPGEVTLTESVLTLGRSLAVEDVFNTPYLSRHIAEHYPSRSVLALPLQADGRDLGALLIGFEQTHSFTEGEIGWAEQAADLIALAIAKAQAYLELERRVERLELLNQITRVATSTLEINAILQGLVEIAADIIGGDGCYITLWDAKRQQVIPTAAFGPLRDTYPLQEPAQTDRLTLTRAVLETRRPLIVEDALNCPYVKRELAEQLPICSLLALPLHADGRDLGALLLSFNQTHRFTQGEIAWAEQAAELIALAIAKAQAYAELEQRVEARTAELQAANEQLRALGRVKDEFVSNVSHELRTPISSLKLYHELLKRNPIQNERYMNRLERETDRLERIIEDLLDLSRMEQGQLELKPESTDLNALAEQYALDRAPLAESHGLNLALDMQPGLPPVQADQRLLGQALSTLLTNAISYTPSGGRVTLLTRVTEREGTRWVGIGVRDTGPGIPPEEHPRLFERFFRGRAARESNTPGTGLGLSIAYEIVERHHGEIEVISAGPPEKGATFIIWLLAEP